MFKDTDLAYTAGYIDGDGCFHIRKQPFKNSHKFMCTLVIASTCEPTINWFKTVFDGNLRVASKVKFGHKPQYHFSFKRKNIEIIDQISTYLVEKREEFKIYKKFHSKENHNIRDSLILNMKDLKFKSNLINKNYKKEIENHKNSITPSQQDFAYLAGFIDAECCLGIQRYKIKDKPNYIYKTLLQCNNSKLPVFYWLIKRFGGHVHFIDRSRFKTPHRNQMTWRLSSLTLFPILEKIIVFLKNKKPVCQELINFYKTTLPNGGARHTEAFRSSYAQVLNRREVIFHKVQFLNKKGV